MNNSASIPSLNNSFGQVKKRSRNLTACRTLEWRMIQLVYCVSKLPGSTETTKSWLRKTNAFGISFWMPPFTLASPLGCLLLTPLEETL
jgi:hypothetical protein